MYTIGLKMAATHLRHMGPCEHPIIATVLGPVVYLDVDRIRLSCTEYHGDKGMLWHDIDFPGDMRHEHTLNHGARVIIPPGDGWDRDREGAEWCYVCPWPHTRGLNTAQRTVKPQNSSVREAAPAHADFSKDPGSSTPAPGKPG